MSQPSGALRALLSGRAGAIRSVRPGRPGKVSRPVTTSHRGASSRRLRISSSRGRRNAAVASARATVSREAAGTDSTIPAGPPIQRSAGRSSRSDVRAFCGSGEAFFGPERGAASAGFPESVSAFSSAPAAGSGNSPEMSTAIHWASGVLHSRRPEVSGRSGVPGPSNRDGRCGIRPPASSRSQRGSRLSGSGPADEAASGAGTKRYFTILPTTKRSRGRAKQVPASAGATQSGQPRSRPTPERTHPSSRHSRAASSHPQKDRGIMIRSRSGPGFRRRRWGAGSGATYPARPRRRSARTPRARRAGARRGRPECP